MSDGLIEALKAARARAAGTELRGKEININFLQGLPEINNINSFRLGAELRKVRKEMGLTQKEFAESIGVTQAMISHYEAGKFRPSDTRSIAVFIGRFLSSRQHTEQSDNDFLRSCGINGNG